MAQNFYEYYDHRPYQINIKETTCGDCLLGIFKKTDLSIQNPDVITIYQLPFPRNPSLFHHHKINPNPNNYPRDPQSYLPQLHFYRRYPYAYSQKIREIEDYLQYIQYHSRVAPQQQIMPSAPYANSQQQHPVMFLNSQVLQQQQIIPSAPYANSHVLNSSQQPNIYYYDKK